MRITQIQISQQNAQLGFKQQNSSIEIQQPKPEVLMNQPQADIQYIQKDAQLNIDQTEAFADADLKHIFRRNEEWAAKGRQHALKAMATAAQQGDQMMKIEHKGSVLPQIAKANSEPTPFEFNIGFVPSSASKVKINYSPGDLTIKIKQNTPEVKINTHEPIIRFKPGQLDIYLKQKSKLSFSVPGLSMDQIG